MALPAESRRNLLYLRLMSCSPLIFLSTYSSKLDDKGRASVPVAFRNILEALGGEPFVYAYPSFVNECIEVCTTERILFLERSIDSMETFSQQRDIMATAILAACQPLCIDNKGRISLSERLLEFAGITKDLLFVGKGKTFEIWQQEKFDTYYNYSRNIAKDNQIALKGASAS